MTKKYYNKDEFKITYIIPTVNNKIKKIKIKKNPKIFEKKIYLDKIQKYFKIQNNFQDRLGHIIHLNEKKFNVLKQYKIIYKKLFKSYFYLNFLISFFKLIKILFISLLLVAILSCGPLPYKFEFNKNFNFFYWIIVKVFG